MAHPHKSEAESSHDRKLAGYKGGPDGSKFSDKGTFSGGPEPDDTSKKIGADETAKIDRMSAVKAYKSGGAVSAKRLDRTPRASGGRMKGKSVVNIVIGAPQAPSAPAMPPEPPEMRSGPVVPPPPPMMGPPPGAGPMPVPRKRGGRISSPADLTAGAMSGDGRLQKVELQKSVKGK